MRLVFGTTSDWEHNTVFMSPSWTPDKYNPKVLIDIGNYSLLLENIIRQTFIVL